MPLLKSVWYTNTYKINYAFKNCELRSKKALILHQCQEFHAILHILSAMWTLWTITSERSRLASSTWYWSKGRLAHPAGALNFKIGINIIPIYSFSILSLLSVGQQVDQARWGKCGVLSLHISRLEAQLYPVWTAAACKVRNLKWLEQANTFRRASPCLWFVVNKDY
jgi:hypothetical protein